MSEQFGLGIIGCGDFLRLMETDLLQSQQVTVTALTDLDMTRAQSYAEKLGGRALETATAVINDPDVDIVCIFVPPWVRRELVIQSAQAGKPIIATKPFLATIEDCDAVETSVQHKVPCGVFYNRTGNSSVETLKRVLDSGEIGRLVLYKREWLHHYPQWNQWALDPDKNGGPFMDAMIHNLNEAHYLMGRPITAYSFFSDNLSHSDKLYADTEVMMLDFADKGVAHLSISWAADLEVHSTDGNYREHIDFYYMITDQGWYVTVEETDGKSYIQARKRNDVKTWAIEALPATPFDRFATAVRTDTAFDRDIVDIDIAIKDIRLLRTAEQNIRRHVVITTAQE